ncbi:delta-lactam-biosynthetic de-N-acetylase [Shouchella patagoniensis]|uniref:delta-lactam-biosynthetic de-N-acetylase n=1 Tax=Shouchella patagoniensis TaxID=228576 RepID=UPI000995C102|nr:delta-lactam-biosynthetic de-N-acetylase [Shouchella patagoniensis]
MKRIIAAVFLLFLFFSLTTKPAYAYDNKTYNWSYKPASTHTPADTEPHYKDMLQQSGGYFIGDTNEKALYLTFDNGYENGYTEQVLDVLAEKRVPGAFFVTGHYLKTAGDLVKRMVNDGHIVGNHSFHHPSLPQANDQKLKEELDSVKAMFMDLTGEKEMHYLRPPRGEFSERTLMKSKELGYTNVFWSLAYKDWEVDKPKGKEYAYEQIMKRIHPGAVMLVHSVSPDNAAALADVIDECERLGYTFRSLDELALSHTLP